MTFLCLACLIAAVGVVTDSPVTVVGAMVVGPEFGPLAALAVALVRRKTYLARRAALALLIGFPVAMLITAIGVLAGEAVGWIEVDQHPRAGRGGLHLPGRAAVVHRRVVRRRGRDAVVGFGEIRRAGRGLHLGDDRAGSGIRRRRRDGRGIGTSPPSPRAQLAINLSGIVLAGVLVLWVRGVADRRHWHVAG